jgi:maleylacetate reductase
MSVLKRSLDCEGGREDSVAQDWSRLRWEDVMQGIQEQFPQERVIFGVPVAEALAKEMALIGARRVFIMCSGTLSRRTPVIDDLKAALGASFVGLFDEMPAHSPRSALLAAAAKAREAKPDLILSVGGGSSIDGAKMMQLMLSETITKHEDFDAFHMRRDAGGGLVNPGFKRGEIDRKSVV